MRRLAVFLAIVGLSITSRAWADPFENLSNRLDEYDLQTQGEKGQQPTRQIRTQGKPITSRQVQAIRKGQTPPSRSSVRQAGGQQYASHNNPSRSNRSVARQVQAMEPEPMSPEPMPEEFGQGQTYDEGGYDPSEMWDNPTGSCSDGSCDMGCGWCKPGFWGRAEYLAWWVRGANTPALVTSSPDTTPVTSAGVLPAATVLFGDQRINTQARSGGRFTLGYWFDPAETLGIEDTFFFIGGSNQGYTNSSSGSPVLARPFYNTDTQANDSVLIAYPQAVAGGINITSSRTVLSNELNIRRALYNDCWRRLDVLVGYRYMRLAEGLGISTNATALDSTALGTQFAVQDQFNTTNNFNGGQLGLNWQFTNGCWTLDLVGKVALGGVSQRAQIAGATQITPSGDATIDYSGGMLAQNSNIGQHNQTVFGVVPEFGANLRYQWTPLWRLNVGYTFMAMTNVLRPGDQISLSLDPNQFPPGTAGTFPQYTYNQSDLWLQGINFGVECNF